MPPRKSDDRLLGEIEATLKSMEKVMNNHMETDKEWHSMTTESLDKLSERITELETIKNKGWGVLFGMSLVSGLLGAGLTQSFKSIFH